MKYTRLKRRFRASQTEDKARRHLVGFVFFLDRMYKKWYNKAAS